MDCGVTKNIGFVERQNSQSPEIKFQMMTVYSALLYFKNKVFTGCDLKKVSRAWFKIVAALSGIAAYFENSSAMV